MKIAIIGETGIIGKAIVERLEAKNELFLASRNSENYKIDLEDNHSIENFFSTIGKVDAIICAAGHGTMGPFDAPDDLGYQKVVSSKLMGQVNLARIGTKYLNAGGSIILTSGQAALEIMPHTTAIAMVCAAINVFVRNAAVEMTDNKRINAVSPELVKETMIAFNMDGENAIPAAQVADVYANFLNNSENGSVTVAGLNR